ncbi:glycosyltransferase family 2 protein [Spirosoma endophyticum]|uniref:Glycosyl transferase family 2 n=1 Tax=Spirosoma endophyticum TaxID=662367 RepID=A0A1I1X1R8_9BACT|nr:glycosyltransferase family 2 protein [Spirosoma endophyticum]SFE01307.1 Glycosyl transferase family 2 [Spirosoma endophyticum]
MTINESTDVSLPPKPHILVIVPCYNEQGSIANVVRELSTLRDRVGYVLDVLVVNDCSTDNSLSIVRTLPCRYLNLPVNLGIGGAMHTGYRYAYQHGYDIAVQVDGDGQHPADELPKVLGPILQQEADVSIGSRFINREGFQSSFLRRVGISYFRWLNQLLIGKTVHDSTSGFRAFNRRTIEIVNKYYPDEYPEPESIVQFGLHGLLIKEVPVRMRHREEGVSSINTSRAFYYMLKVSLAIVFMYFRLLNKRAL